MSNTHPVHNVYIHRWRPCQSVRPTAYNSETTISCIKIQKLTYCM